MKKVFTIILGIAIAYSCSNSSDGGSNSTETYESVQICNQTWMKKNLNVSKYRNGDVIPQVTDATQWSNLTTGAWCYYNNDSANGTVYGKLYNWYAVNDPRGLAPQGWHIPTNAEWTTLTTCLGGISTAGAKMKETGDSHWLSPNLDANNSSGFIALPGGSREYDNLFTSQFIFTSIRANANWWSSSEYINNNTAHYRYLNYVPGYVICDCSDGNKVNGYSVRCIKD